jgi:hypothetical protein
MGEVLNIFKNKFKKNSFKSLFACKSLFWEKRLAMFFQSDPFGS